MLMGTSQKKDTRIVFLVRDRDSLDVVIDEVIKVGEDKFKSIKFRRTFYKEADFDKSPTAFKKVAKQLHGISI
jgi:hypothetical protein